MLWPNLILAFVAILPIALSQDRRPLLIRGATVIDTETGKSLSGLDVLIERERIVKAGVRIRVPQNADVFDAAGMYLMPGLWDMHVHAFWTESNPERLFPLFLANGVTGIRDMGSPLDLETLQKMRATLTRQATSPRIVMAGKLVDGDPPVWAGSLAVSTRSEAERAVQALRNAGADLVKVYSRLSRAGYQDVTAAARRARLPVAGHIPITVPAMEAARAGQHTVEHLSELLLACSTEESKLRDELLLQPPGKARDAVRRAQVRQLVETFSDAKARVLSNAFRRHGTWQVPTLLVQRTYAYPPANGFSAEPWAPFVPKDTITGYTNRLAAFRAGKSSEDLAWQTRTYDAEARLVSIMSQQGVGFLVGTDADLFHAAGFGVHREMELLVAAGLSPADALRAATLNPARALRSTQRFGTVQAGKMADLVLLDANPLQDIRNTRRIRAVVLKGRLFSREELDRMLRLSASNH